MSRSAMEVLLDADCTGYEKLVLLVIARHGRGTNGSSGFPSTRRIARMAGISTSTLCFTLKSLSEKHWLTQRHGVGRGANKYTIHLDAIPVLPDLWATARSDSTVESQDVASVSTREPQDERSDSHVEPQDDGGIDSHLEPQESVVTRGGVRSDSHVESEASTKASTNTNTNTSPASGSGKKEINDKEESPFPDDEPVAANRSALHKNRAPKAALSAKGKPSRGEHDQPSKPSDPRHAPCCKAIAEYWQAKNPGLDMDWGLTVKHLKRWLSASPKTTVEQFRQFLHSRANSECVNHGEQPSGWIRKITNYAHGPLDRFGKPMTGTAKGEKLSEIDYAAEFHLPPGTNVGKL